jgi:flagella basal body P-ring formation protein FlgA
VASSGVIFLTLAICLSGGLAAEPATPATIAARIDAEVRAYLEARPELAGADHNIETGRLDARFRKECPTALEIFLPQGYRLQGKTTIGVRCPAPETWTIYVPAQVHVYGDVVVLALPAARGAPIPGSALRVERRDLGTLAAGALQDPAAAVGMLPRRALPQGAVLRAAMLEAAPLVRRGQQVTIQAEITGLSVKSAGEALADGSQGELVRVRNLLTNKVITAIVMAPGEVRVPL